MASSASCATVMGVVEPEVESNPRLSITRRTALVQQVPVRAVLAVHVSGLVQRVRF
jgi:hypothetical protein